MPISVNVGGTFRPAVAWMNVGGVWKQCSVWMNVGGVWKNLSFSGDYTIGNETSSPLGSTGRTVYRRTLTAVVNGGGGSYTYSWAVSNQTGAQLLSLSSTTIANPVASSTWYDFGNPNYDGEGASALVTLTITDNASGRQVVVSKTVTL